MQIRREETTQLRRFLIGALEEAEDCEVGERLLTDNEYFAQLAIVEDELIDDYLAGRLSRNELTLFENHFMLSRSHQEKLRFAQALRKYVKTESQMARAAMPVFHPKRASRIFSLLFFRVALPAATVILVALVGYRIYIHKSDLQRGQDLLKDMYKNERPVKSRIALLNWAPFIDTRAGRSSQSGKEELEKQSAHVLLAQALKDNPGPASEHAFGEFSLATGEFDEAIKHLSLAVKGDPNNTTYQSDLGAALLEKGVDDRQNGRANEAAKEFDRSLEELEHAISIDGDFTPALFNRALCLEVMERWRQAEAAWVNYLAKDPNSPWSLDAKKSLDSVRQK
ncbi:MAG: tetratricopeptide repeat protein [Blastocatellia bacterium]